MVDRRHFLHLAAATPLLSQSTEDPACTVVTPFQRSDKPGMPGPYPGEVVRVHSEKAADSSNQPDRAVVKQMISAGMKSLTGDAREADAWRRFVSPEDTVGIKVNCSGAPGVYSSTEVIAAIVENLTAIGLPPNRIYIFDRFGDQLSTIPYALFTGKDVNIVAVETSETGPILPYDPRIYLEANLFGEEDTRSNLARLVSEKLTKIINVPTAKEHQAAGVTGCLKNIAYGAFSNVARTHRYEKTHTRTLIGRLASVEPLRSRVVLNIMDGLRGVWNGGPFSTDARFRFYPKELLFGTDPVAMDHKLIELIEAKRKAEGATSIYDRSRSLIGDNRDARKNPYFREPGHVEYASTLGLGVYDNGAIKLRAVEL